MNADKIIIGLEPRESEPCSICGARNTDTRKIRIDTYRSGNLITFSACRLCVRQMALDACAAWFDFTDTAQTKTPEQTPASEHAG